MVHAPDAADGVVMDVDKPLENASTPATTDARRVLTLYGGERSAKQLFSSLGKRKSPDDFNEQALPNGISTTTVLPAHTSDEITEKKPTFGEQFATTHNLTPLSPPRPSKYTTTRNSSVHWHTPSLFQQAKKSPDRKVSFSSQPLATGAWLHYNVPPIPGQESLDAKRKQRDLRSSYGEAPSPTKAEASAALDQAKDDALYQSVYSSFAPDKDDSLAIIATQQKDRLWWSKYGQDMYQELLDTRDEALYGVRNGDVINDSDVTVDVQEIREIAKTWKPPNIDDTEPIVNGDAAATSKKNAEDLLREISDLLETLSSYQRARLESLPTSNRPSTAHGSSISGTASGPSDPTSAEIEAYNALKAQLESLISDLPPYLLSKVNGDKLADLRVSTKIRVPGKNPQGTLEDNELSATLQTTSRGAVAPAVNQPPSTYANPQARSSYGPQNQSQSPHYPRNAYGPPAPPRAPATNAYAGSHYAPRQTPSQYQQPASRASYAQQSYSSQRPPSYADRFANGMYNTPQNYGTTPNGSRASGPQGGTYSQQYSTPQPRMPAPVAGSLTGYRAANMDYQRSAAMQGSYNYGSAPTGASPQPPQRQSFSAQGQGSYQQRPSGYSQSPSYYASRPSAEPQVNGTSARRAGGPSPADQAAMINRQKDQVPDQRQQQGSGSPQPIVENGIQPDRSATTSH